MRPRPLALALVTGVAGSLVVGLAVTALLGSRIAFSALVGIPAGLLAGAAAAGAVYLGLEADTRRRRRVAFAVAAAGAGFLVTLAVAVAAGLPRPLSTGAAAFVGFVAGAAGYRRGPATRPDATD